MILAGLEQTSCWGSCETPLGIEGVNGVKREGTGGCGFVGGFGDQIVIACHQKWGKKKESAG